MTPTEDLLIALQNWLDEQYEHNVMRSDRRVELAEELQIALTHSDTNPLTLQQ